MGKEENIRVLFVTPRLPYPLDRGGEIVTFNILSRIARKCEVTLASLTDEDDAEAQRILGSICREVRVAKRRGRTEAAVVADWLRGASYLGARHRSKRLCRVVEEMIGKHEVDVVQYELFFMAQLAAGRQRCAQVLTMHNVHSDLFARMSKTEGSIAWRAFSAIESRRVAAEESATWRRMSRNVAISAADAKAYAMRGGVPSKCVTISPGVDVDWHSGLGRAESEDPTIAFIGALHYLPNVDAAKFLVREVMPLVWRERPKARVMLAGRRPGAEVMALGAQRNVEVHPDVDDIRMIRQKCWVEVAPLRFGSGVRIKLMEALASAVPVVSTSAGAEGLDLKDGRDLSIADDAPQFAAAIVGLLANKQRRRDLASRGQQTVKQLYSWDAAAAQYLAMYEELLAQATTAGSAGRSSRCGEQRCIDGVRP